MPKCPECGSEVTELHLYGKQVGLWRVWVNGGDLEYEWIDSSSDLENEEYVCPECGEVLFKNEEEAKEFLKPKTKQTTLPMP